MERRIEDPAIPQARIEDFAQELGYRPPPHDAEMLQTGETQLAHDHLQEVVGQPGMTKQ